jgi:hypothetical protein
VAAGGEAGVHERAGGSTVHREISSGLKTGLEIGAGVVAAGLIVGGLAALASSHSKSSQPATSQPATPEPEDASDIKDPPHCGDPQQKIIKSVLAKAVTMVKTALEKIHAFQANPRAPENAGVQTRLTARFRSDEAKTVEKVERVVNRIGRQLADPPPIECQSAKSDEECSWARAYALSDASKIVLCPGFFKSDDNVLGIVHEMAHATTGGPRIRDRGYQNERILPLLSTEEALINAESYAEFVWDITTGVYKNEPPDDKIDCPEKLKDRVKVAVAKAERWTTNSLTVVTGAEQEGQAFLRSKLPSEIPAAPDDFKHIIDVYKRMHKAFSQPLGFVCLDEKNGFCGEGPIYLSPGDTNLYICPRWQTLDPDHQVISLLDGCFGVFAGETNESWRTGLANLAQFITNEVYPIPSPQEVFGDSTWTPDALAIWFKRESPVIGGTHDFYRESKTIHERFSADVPRYLDPSCTLLTLPLNFSVLFTVDEKGKPRPGPFAPPIVSVRYSFTGAAVSDPSLEYFQEDTNARYAGAFAPLETKLKSPFHLNFTRNGTFHMNFRLEDPDSQTVLTYDDQIQVDAVQACQSPPTNKQGQRASASAAGDSPGSQDGKEEA